MRDAIQGVDDFDFMVIDSPPSLALLTINALAAATHVIIPTQPEKFWIDRNEGAPEHHDSIKNRIDPGLEILGALVTQMKSKTVLTKTILPVISQFFPVFEHTISDGVAVGESHLARRSFTITLPRPAKAKRNTPISLRSCCMSSGLQHRPTCRRFPARDPRRHYHATQAR